MEENLSFPHYTRKARPFTAAFAAFCIIILGPFSASTVRGESPVPPHTAGYVENVIILVIDGLRNEEAFDDPTHQYIPMIWNELRPQGTIYTQMYTTNWPVTTSGHLSMVNGGRKNIPLSAASYSGNSREHRPTIFETYRKTYDLPMSEAWIVSGKNQLSTCAYSLHPLWGWNYRSNVEINVGTNDRETMERFYEVMEVDQPSLSLINLREVDHRAHQGSYEDYTGAIMIADTLCMELWETLQNDTHYEDRTILMITTDHGRACFNYQNHGGTDHCNRHCMFLALGPGIEQNAVYDRRSDLIDIASTVAWIYDLELPYSEGQVLSEMFERFGSAASTPPSRASADSAFRLSDSAAPSHDPSIIVDANGRLHVVWSERIETTGEEKRAILRRTSENGGTSWSEPDTVTDGFGLFRPGLVDGIKGAAGSWNGDDFAIRQGFSLEKTGTPLYARVEADSSGEPVVGVCGYAQLSMLERTDLRWGVNFYRDKGGSWSEQGFENLGAIVDSPPAMDLDAESVWSAWTDGVGKLSIGTLKSYDDVARRSFTLPDLREELGFYYRNPASALSNGLFHVVFEFLSRDQGFLNYLRYDTRGDTVTNLLMLDRNGYPSVSPNIDAAGDNVGAVWAEHVDGTWHVDFVRSSDAGQTFSEPLTITADSYDAWNPDILLSDDTVIVVWEDYRDGNAEIYATASEDMGDTWGSQIRVTDDESFSANPRLAFDESTVGVVWQDYRDGNWEIYFSGVDLTRLLTE